MYNKDYQDLLEQQAHDDMQEQYEEWGWELEETKWQEDEHRKEQGLKSYLLGFFFDTEQ